MALTELHAVLALRNSVRNPVPSDVVPLIENIHRLLNIRGKKGVAAPAPAKPVSKPSAPVRSAWDAPKASEPSRSAWDSQEVEWRTVEPRSRPKPSEAPRTFAASYARRGGRMDGRSGREPRESRESRDSQEAKREIRETQEAKREIRETQEAKRDTPSQETQEADSAPSSRPSSASPRRHRARGGARGGGAGRGPKYVSKFKRSAENVDDTIVNTILLGKLNKFSPSNYADIKEFITHIIASGETEMIKCFMKIVFEKAASEEIFCPLYARLLGELSAIYPVLLGEMALLYEQYMTIFEEIPIQPVGDGSTARQEYDALCKRNVEKKYRRGYSQFLAELIQHEVIDTTALLKIIHTIVHHVELHQEAKENIGLIEEYADCLMKVVKATTKASAENEAVQIIRDSMKASVLDRLLPLTVRVVERVGVSNKARFTFLDMTEAIQRY
jgi:hypothetical protein